MTITQKQFFECADVPIEQHIQFEKYLTEILLINKEEKPFTRPCKPTN